MKAITAVSITFLDFIMVLTFESDDKILECSNIQLQAIE